MAEPITREERLRQFIIREGQVFDSKLGDRPRLAGFVGEAETLIVAQNNLIILLLDRLVAKLRDVGGR